MLLYHALIIVDKNCYRFHIYLMFNNPKKFSFVLLIILNIIFIMEDVDVIDIMKNYESFDNVHQYNNMLKNEIDKILKQIIVIEKKIEHQKYKLTKQSK